MRDLNIAEIAVRFQVPGFQTSDILLHHDESAKTKMDYHGYGPVHCALCMPLQRHAPNLAPEVLGQAQRTEYMRMTKYQVRKETKAQRTIGSLRKVVFARKF